MRMFINEFNEALSLLKKDIHYKNLKDNHSRTLTMATGKLTYPTIRIFASQIMELFPNVHINVVCIRNDFFGETITVSGLITGQDLIK